MFATYALIFALIAPIASTTDVPSTAQVHRVAAYNGGDGKDQRQSFEEFAKTNNINLEELEQNFSASGGLFCGGSAKGSAQITVRADIITTAAHMLFDGASCEPYWPASACYFSYVYKKEMKRIRVDSLIAHGSSCAGGPGYKNDWAILKLHEAAIGPKPYAVDRQKVLALAAKPFDLSVANINANRVLAVADHSVDFCLKNENGQCRRFGRKYVYPRHIQYCNVMNTYGYEPFLIESDCAVGSGAYGDRNSTEEEWQEKLTGMPVIKAYHTFSWATTSVPVTGELYQALSRLVEKNDLPVSRVPIQRGGGIRGFRR